MTKDSFDRLVRGFSNRTPWRPFTIELLSGTRIEVNHPEALTERGDVFQCRSTSGLNCYFEYTAVVRFIDATGT
jgi:hypothetical protein